jgi:hypothetical protein
MNAVDGATIELRIRISRPDEGRGRCKGSRAWDPRKDFSQCMQQPTTPSTSSATSSQAERTEPSGPRRCRHGTKPSPRREPNGPGDLLRALFGNVTEPPRSFWDRPGTFESLAPSINYSSCHDVAKLYSVRLHSGDMAHIRDTAPVICRGFVIFEVRHAKWPQRRAPPRPALTAPAASP